MALVRQKAKRIYVAHTKTKADFTFSKYYLVWTELTAICIPNRNSLIRYH